MAVLYSYSAGTANNGVDTNEQMYVSRYIGLKFTPDANITMESFKVPLARITTNTGGTITWYVYQDDDPLGDGTLVSSGSFANSLVSYQTYDARGTFFDDIANWYTVTPASSVDMTKDSQYLFVFQTNVTSTNAVQWGYAETDQVGDGVKLRNCATNITCVNDGTLPKYPIFQIEGIATPARKSASRNPHGTTRPVAVGRQSASGRLAV